MNFGIYVYSFLLLLGEKPFHCELCGQPFTQSGSRNVHMRRHHSKPSTVPPGGSTLSNITQSEVVSEGDIRPSNVITSSDVTQFVTIATDSIIGVTTECVPKAEDQIDDTSEDARDTISHPNDYSKSTLIIMTGTQEYQYSGIYYWSILY